MSKARDIADLDFNSPDIDGGNIDGATIGGTTPAAGSFSQVDVDNITSSGNLTIDVAGDIILDADDEGKVNFKDGGTQYARIDNNGGTGLDVVSTISDGDIRFRGNDGGSTIQALSLDMSLGGTAIFNDNVGIGQSPTAFANWRVLELKAGSAGAMLNYENSSSARVAAVAYDEGSAQFRIQTMVDADIKFEPNNAVALTLDGSQNALFAGTVETGGTLYIPQWIEHSGDPNTYFGFPSGDQFKIVTGNTGRLHITGSESVWNEGGEDKDFRVESNNKPNAFRVDAGADQVRTDAVFVHDADGSNQPFYITRSGGTDQGLAVTVDDNNVMLRSIQDEPSGANFIFYSSNATTTDLKLLQLDYSAGAVFNEDGVSYQHVRMESDTDSHAFYLNAVNGYVGLGAGASPTQPLSVGARTGANLNYINGTTNSVSTASGVLISDTITSESDAGFGLLLANNANNDNARSPIIGFSALSASSGYNHMYAAINARKISNGADTNWNTGQLEFSTGSGTGPHIRMKLDRYGGLITTPTTAGHTVFNEDGVDADFRVESDSAQYALFVDASNDVTSVANADSINAAFADKARIGFNIDRAGIDDHGGHMFMTQLAAEDAWMDICQCHDANATGVLFFIHGVRGIDQNRSYGAMVRYAYQNAFNVMSVNQQNTTIEYRVSNNMLQYRFTTAGPYIVNLTVMAAG